MGEGIAKETGFSKATSLLMGEIEALDKRVELLLSRAEPVLALEKPSDPSKQEPRCPEPAVIRVMTDASERVKRIRAVVDDILIRLEI